MQNSPASSGNPFPCSSTPNSFMDTFDFANPDFSTANSGLEDLNIFPSSNHALSLSSNHNAHADTGSAPVSHHPSLSANFSHIGSDSSAQSHSKQAFYLNNTSHASSPLPFSRNRFGGKQSPASLQSNAHTPPSSTPPSHMNHAPAIFGADQNGQSSTAMQSSHSGQSRLQGNNGNGNGNNNNNNRNRNGEEEGQMPQLSISDLQQMLMEREKAERIQNMQTALLKQQLDQLSRMQQAQQQQQQHHQYAQQQQHHQQQQQQNLQLNPSGQDGQLSSGQQQSLLMALQNAFAAGSNPNARNNVVQAAQFQQQQQQQPQQQMNNGQGDQSNVLAQYGLITPMGSGPFNSSACPPGSANFMSPLAIQPNSQPASVGVEHRPGHDYLGSYTPLESPAVTPASVFSTASTAIVMSELFSPLTSPALGPQPPSLNEMMLPPASLQHHAQTSQAAMHGSPPLAAVNNNSFTPTASPLALIVKGSSKIRKNRSTTAEAKANKVRPSPLMKPVSGPLKKKKETLTSPGTATPTANGGYANGGYVNGGSSSGPSSRRASITTFGAGAEGRSRNQSADVAQSEGTSSTPSPIDLSREGAMPPPSGPTAKILTPASIMGIRSSPSGTSTRNPNPGANGKGKASEFQPQQQVVMSQPQPMALPPQQPPMGYPSIAPFPTPHAGGPKVTFNLSPQQHIQPSGLSQADRDTWMTYKSAGGLESRRTSHKAAEQKRRDSLKFCFDELRGLLPAITLDEDAPNGSLLGPDGAEEDVQAEGFDLAEVGDPEQARAANKAISKVALLRHSNEYLIRLKKRLERRDKALEVCRREVRGLREKLAMGESEDPSVTGKGAPLGWTDRGVVGYDYPGSPDGQAEGEDEERGKVEMDQTA